MHTQGVPICKSLGGAEGIHQLTGMQTFIRE
jgi:hypothetical protein